MEKVGSVGSSYGGSSAEATKIAEVVAPEVAKVSEAPKVNKVEGKGKDTSAKDKDPKEPKDPKDRQVSESSINDAVSSANRKMEKTRCEYSYHKETNRVSIKVIDEETKKVIREIPPEKSLDMLQKMWEMAGILVDEKR
ncbi:MAG: flagellar protein FlaG [Eubacterium sp.]|nr:flagellar protein FlaG [Eubacterium sp.]